MDDNTTRTSIRPKESVLARLCALVSGSNTTESQTARSTITSSPLRFRHSPHFPRPRQSWISGNAGRSSVQVTQERRTEHAEPADPVDLLRTSQSPALEAEVSVLDLAEALVIAAAPAPSTTMVCERKPTTRSVRFAASRQTSPTLLRRRMSPPPAATRSTTSFSNTSSSEVNVRGRRRRREHSDAEESDNSIGSRVAVSSAEVLASPVASMRREEARVNTRNAIIREISCLARATIARVLPQHPLQSEGLPATTTRVGEQETRDEMTSVATTEVLSMQQVAAAATMIYTPAQAEDMPVSAPTTWRPSRGWSAPAALQRLPVSDKFTTGHKILDPPPISSSSMSGSMSLHPPPVPYRSKPEINARPDE